jgi:2-polyprenyl-3-methyl-5-hydroxy-6-metoxy-1,4-benzoquinol methylase
MTPQIEIQAAYIRASYHDLVDPSLPTCWFGAGEFSHRLAAALSPAELSRVDAIFDEAPNLETGPIAGAPVRQPLSADSPAQIVLATDTHSEVYRQRCGTIWKNQPAIIDLYAPPRGAWTHPGDEPLAFASLHPERWRESIGQAQLRLEAQGKPVSPSDRWMLSHALLCGATQRLHFGCGDENRFLDLSDAIPAGQVITASLERPNRPDPFWGDMIAANHSAVSPDGLSAAIVWASRDAFPACPLRIGGALWIPKESSGIVQMLYGGSSRGSKEYTVRFDNGKEFLISATRERTYADIRGSAELKRYERFIGELPIGARILDCACGSGFGADLLASQGFDVTGADIDHRVIEFARSRYPGIEFICAAAKELPFPDDCFDAVISVETIEHLPAPGDALAEFARVCNPEGQLCLTTPGEGASDSPFHESEMTTNTLQQALDQAYGANGWTQHLISGARDWRTIIVRQAQGVAF